MSDKLAVVRLDGQGEARLVGEVLELVREQLLGVVVVVLVAVLQQLQRQRLKLTGRVDKGVRYSLSQRKTGLDDGV